MMNNAIDYLFHKPMRILAAVWSYVGHLFSDETYIKVRFRLLMGKWPDLKNPKTFSEKLQWLKIHYRRPEFTTMVDKLAVKDYVSGIIGEEFVIPNLGVWDRPEDIEWDKLPNQFVLKTTHGGGSLGVVVCKDKNTLDKKKAISKLKASMGGNAYRVQGEWPYKDVPHKVLAEKYIEPRLDLKDLPDYKFICFDGEVKGLFVATERQNPNEDVQFEFFDADYNHLPFRKGHDYAKVTPLKPENFELMKEIASKLSRGTPQVRVDLYDLGNKVFFGEITMYHFGGFVPFEPDQWDKRFGDMINLPGEKLGEGFICQSQESGIFIQQYDLADFKWYCFNGEPVFCQVIANRSSKETIDFFDTEWNHQNFVGLAPNVTNADVLPLKPDNLNVQVRIARELSKGIPFSRIDLYETGGKTYFGEITFYPISGFGYFRPEQYNEILGKMLILPEETVSGEKQRTF